jgi:hypothetical protein
MSVSIVERRGQKMKLSERIRKYWEITNYDELADEVAKLEEMMSDELVADDERTIEICSREILRLEARERDLEAEIEALRELLEEGRDLILRMRHKLGEAGMWETILGRIDTLLTE